MEAKTFLSKTRGVMIIAFVNLEGKVTFHYLRGEEPRTEISANDIVQGDFKYVYQEATAWVENQGYALWSF